MARKAESVFLRAAVVSSGAVVALVTLAIVVYVFAAGAPHVNAGLFSPSYTSENASLFPALVNTLIVLAISLSISGIVGVCAAIFLVDCAKPSSPIVRVIGMTAQTLSGIPSIVFGLAGYMAFSVAAGWQFSLLSGALTLAIMTLPLVMRSAQEALLAVPRDLIDGSLALGASEFRTLALVELPAARKGIVNGIILGGGRVMGESAALIYTAGTVCHVPKTLMGSGRTLAVHLYCLWNEGLRVDSACATAAMLLVFCIILNAASRLVSRGEGCARD